MITKDEIEKRKKKAALILQTVEQVRVKRTEVDRNLKKLERLARMYQLGLDPHVPHTTKVLETNRTGDGDLFLPKSWEGKKDGVVLSCAYCTTPLARKVPSRIQDLSGWVPTVEANLVEVQEIQFVICTPCLERK